MRPSRELPDERRIPNRPRDLQAAPAHPRPTQPPDDEFSTPDLMTGAFLVVNKVPLIRLDRLGERSFFVFPGSAREVARRLFRAGEDLVPAREFHRTLRELRGLVRGERR